MNSMDEDNIPEWKKALMVDLKTYAKTITSASGSIKLTCPKEMRPKLKKQISSSKEATKSKINNDKVKHEQNNDIPKLNGKLKQMEEHLKHNYESYNDEIIQKCLNKENNFIKPGMVKTLKSKYQSMMQEENKGIKRRTKSYEIFLEKNDVYHEKPRRKDFYTNKKENILLNKNELPPPRTVKKTKEIFEHTVKPVEQNVFDIKQNKPTLMTKPKITPKVDKPSLTTDNLQPSSLGFFRKAPIVKPFCNCVTSPTSPIKSGRNLC